MVTFDALYSGISDNENSMEVKRLQYRLSELGYFYGNTDGIYGTETEEAVRFFQAVNGLEVTGHADQYTLMHVYSEDAILDPEPTEKPIQKGDKSDKVRELQTLLVKYGFLDTAADGTFGEKTEIGVKEAQTYYKIYLEKKWANHPTPTPSPTKAWVTPTPTPVITPALTVSTTLMPGETPELPTPTPSLRPAPTATPWAASGIPDEELIAWLSDGEFDPYQGDVKNGDKNEEARRLQRRLVTLGYLRKADGHFGSNTERALKYFQYKNGLPETGIADSTTMRKLCADSSVSSDTIVTRYRIRISTAKQRVYVYEWDGRDFDKCIKEMKCSTGLDATPTPKGTFWNTAPLKEWWYFTEFDCWAKYAWCIDGGIFFHSVIFSKQDESTLRTNTVKNLGKKASHGCVRLTVDNAKWIFTNCPAGTPVIVE